MKKEGGERPHSAAGRPISREFLRGRKQAAACYRTADTSAGGAHNAALITPRSIESRGTSLIIARSQSAITEPRDQCSIRLLRRGGSFGAAASFIFGRECRGEAVGRARERCCGGKGVAVDWRTLARVEGVYAPRMTRAGCKSLSVVNFFFFSEFLGGLVS